MLSLSFIENPTPNQIDEIVALYKAEKWWEKVPDDETAIRQIISGSHCFVIATLENKIIGMGRSISDGASDAYIQDVTVKQTERGKKIGSKIINRIVERLNADGIFWIGLIAEKNSSSFYEKIGFFQMPNSAPMLKRY